MDRRSKFSKELKLEIIMRYLDGESASELARIYQVHKRTISDWVNKFSYNGESAFDKTSKNQSYTKGFKEKVILEYLEGTISYRDLANKYTIKTRKQVIDWVKQYNSHEQPLRAYHSGGGAYMTEGRKTTFDERIKIVEYCLKEEKNYQKTADYFQVSYQQVYSWIKKYEKNGVRALKDNRGRGKLVEDMTELERLTVENKLLQVKIEQLEVEKELKKKVEFMRRNYHSKNNTRK